MNGFNQSGVYEQQRIIHDETGYRIQLDEVTLNQVDLKWGAYLNPEEKVLLFHPDRPTIISHFRMYDPRVTVDLKRKNIREKQFVIYREAVGPYELWIPPTKDKGCSFFELIMSDHFFNNIMTDESEFMSGFRQHATVSTPSLDFTAQMNPAMYGVINEMRNSPYRGHLKAIYLEAKAIELFLMQINQLDRLEIARRSKLKARDIESLHAVKTYMELNYNNPCSITELARIAGINQMKLKNGFKELFNTTVFGYLSNLRMQEAKRLLIDEKMYVNEVADLVGYKHPHHFTAAFRKKFGMVPKDLKS